MHGEASSTFTEVRSTPSSRSRSAKGPPGRSTIVDTSLLDGSRAGLIAAQPAWMLCGSACISGSLVNALWLGINLSATPRFPFTMAVAILTGVGPLLIALCLWIALRAFGRHPSTGSRASILAVYALATSFFACCAVVQIVVLEPLRGALPASRATSFNAIAIGLAAVPSIALAFATTGLLRADIAHLARYGFRAARILSLAAFVAFPAAMPSMAQTVADDKASGGIAFDEIIEARPNAPAFPPSTFEHDFQLASHPTMSCETWVLRRYMTVDRERIDDSCHGVTLIVDCKARTVLQTYRQSKAYGIASFDATPDPAYAAEFAKEKRMRASMPKIDNVVVEERRNLGVDRYRVVRRQTLTGPIGVLFTRETTTYAFAKTRLPELHCIDAARSVYRTISSPGFLRTGTSTGLYCHPSSSSIPRTGRIQGKRSYSPAVAPPLIGDGRPLSNANARGDFQQLFQNRVRTHSLDRERRSNLQRTGRLLEGSRLANQLGPCPCFDERAE